ncbi:MAG: methyltransferase domain-containing protein [Candidatus Pacearchaeota archaeon]|jgi:ubiquinone/menaquinone biosynthesis C-methylase UbiE
MLSEFYYGLIQRIFSQKINRINESVAVMTNNVALDYNRAGNNGSLDVIYQLILDKLLNVAPNSGKVLDISTGNSQILCRLAKNLPNLDFTGIDLSKDMLEIAKNNVTKNNLNNIKLKKHDMFKLDKLNKKYDLIIWTLAMHHCKNETQVIKVINDSLKLLNKDGILFIFDIERPKTKKISLWFANRYNSKFGEYHYKDSLDSYNAAFSYEEFENMIKKSNWKNYIHKDPFNANFFQYAISKTKNKFNRKNKPEFSNFKDRFGYYFLKLNFYLNNRE